MAAVVEAVDSRADPKPPLKWAGGKRWLVPHLTRLWDPHRSRRLVEPLCGGLAVSLGLAPARALISDLNPHTINFYSWLKKGLRITLTMRNDESCFYEQRTRFNQLVRENKADGKEAASIFYYLNRTCYNGLCRFNSKGEFNVPYGRYKKLIYKTDFTEYASPFAQWDFTCVDFEKLCIATRRFRLRRSALRRSVHGLFQGKFSVGRSSPVGAMARAASRSCNPVKSGYGPNPSFIRGPRIRC